MNFAKRLPPMPGAGVQMTAMMDIVFILLFFFVATQIYAKWESEIDVTLPTAEKTSPPQRLLGEVIVNIRADGEVVMNGRVLGEEELRATMERLVSLHPGHPVLIRADRKTPYERVIRVLDLCRQADIWNISFATLSSGA